MPKCPSCGAILEVYNRLRMSPNFTFKVGRITFKLSKTAEGTEWLQRWTPISQGGRAVTFNLYR